MKREWSMVNGEWTPLRNFASPLRSLRLNGAALSSTSMLLLLRPQFNRKERKEVAKFRKEKPQV